MFESRSPYVSANDTLSEAKNVVFGVLHGSIFGPSYFILFMNNCLNAFKLF